MAPQGEELHRYETPYNRDHPIPTIERYERAKELRQANSVGEEEGGLQEKDVDTGDGNGQDTSIEDTSEINHDPKSKRLSKRKDKATRIVTDPVTHLPVKIHDFTTEALEKVDKNSHAYGTTPETASGAANRDKSPEQLKSELQEIARGQAALQAEFPPPEYQSIQKDLSKIAQQSAVLSVVSTAFIIAAAAPISISIGKDQLLLQAGLAVLAIGTVVSLIIAIGSWADRRTQSLWDGAVWQGKFKEITEEHPTETTAWLNSLLGAVWPLMNPDLFVSLADTLEDVMQASLPSIVRMVSVDDIGQGSEALRILGIRWLPTGAAAREVSEDGNFQSIKRRETSDSQPDSDPSGLAAEDGDFINLEIAFAYRASSSGSTFKDRMKDMHIYLAFYLPGNIKLPVWVDLRGVVGLVRLRLQLVPDPPFFGLCTMTMLGQPKVELSCVPLIKRGLNLMNFPVLKSFVQGSIDAAMAEYVAPKSLTLNLKDMIAGDDFKKDTVAKGVLFIEIIRGYNFKTGDMGIPLIKNSSADPYVSVGWAKFGKPVWSTRILENEMEPIWNETTYVLVTPDELNVDERLRLQLWDSDRFSADDDLGRIEVDLKELMSQGMHTRKDGFRALKAGKEMPGQLEWRVGYFPKIDIQKDQLEKQSFDKETRTFDALEKKAAEVSKRKLRETEIKEGHTKDKAELDQQRQMELQTQETEMMIDAPPPEDYPSGIVSIQIHQITSLELSKLHKQDNKYDKEDAEEEDLPSAYCTIILNHAKVYKTRTKPKNPQPFFNAGTEKFVGDWRTAEIHVSVRDARVHEDDSLLGIVHLPLSEVFKERSQSNGFYPIAGGVGYGRIRISMVWRSVKLQVQPELRGWQRGTLEILETTSVDLPAELKSLNLKLKAGLTEGKLHNKHGEWHKKHSIKLAVIERYSTCFTARFRAKGLTGNKTVAFAIMWLRDIPDEVEKEMELTVWKGDFHKALKSSISDCGDKVGTIKVKMTFWSGLGSAHTQWAIKQADNRDVVQVLETAHDNLEDSKAEKAAGIVDEDDHDKDDNDSDSDSDSDEDEHKAGAQEPETPARHDSNMDGQTDAALDEDSTKNKILGPIKDFVDEAKDYKDNYKSIHRRNRGIMTWKAPRTAQWAFHSAGKIEHKVTGIFKRHSRGVGIETEA